MYTPRFSPKGVREVQHHSDGGPFFFHVVKIMYFNSHKNPLMWYSSTALISFTGDNPAQYIHTLLYGNQSSPCLGQNNFETESSFD